MQKHKKQFIVASSILGVLAGGVLAYFAIDEVQERVNDAYHTVLKTLVTDRALDGRSDIYSNLVYCQPGTAHQTLDLYMPDNRTAAPVPLVIFIHGGGWRTGDKANREVAYYGEALLRRGIAVASLNYRLGAQYPYPTPDRDVACALQYLHNHASRYQLSERWGIFGDSAGAQLGARAMTQSSHNSHLYAFVGFYGPYDLALQTTRPDNDALRYTNRGRDSFAASPLSYPPKKDAYYLLVHGVRDTTVLPIQSERFYNTLQSEGIASRLVLVDNASHSFTPRSRPSASSIRDIVTKTFVEQLGGSKE